MFLKYKRLSFCNINTCTYINFSSSMFNLYLRTKSPALHLIESSSTKSLDSKLTGLAQSNSNFYKLTDSSYLSGRMINIPRSISSLLSTFSQYFILCLLFLLYLIQYISFVILLSLVELIGRHRIT